MLNRWIDKIEMQIRTANIRLFIWIVIISFIISALCIGFYLFKFHAGLAEKQETWGQFGDFIGGFLNPVLSFINLIILIALTVKLNDRSEKHQKELQQKQISSNLISEIILETKKSFRKLVSIYYILSYAPSKENTIEEFIIEHSNMLSCIEQFNLFFPGVIDVNDVKEVHEHLKGFLNKLKLNSTSPISKSEWKVFIENLKMKIDFILEKMNYTLKSELK